MKNSVDKKFYSTIIQTFMGWIHHSCSSFLESSAELLMFFPYRFQEDFLEAFRDVHVAFHGSYSLVPFYSDLDRSILPYTTKVGPIGSTCGFGGLTKVVVLALAWGPAVSSTWRCEVTASSPRKDRRLWTNLPHFLFISIDSLKVV